MSEEKILSRVRKMMALAENEAASEGERDNAVRMAYKLLAKHNLTMVDVEMKAAEQDDKREIYETVTRSQLWARHVCNIVAKLFFCQYFSGRKINADKCVHHFVGKESNATTAMLLSDFIVQSLVKESRRLYKNDLTPEARSFCLGAVNKLRERVKEIQAQQESELDDAQATGTSLVLASLYKREEDANALVVQNSHFNVTVSRGGKSTVKRDAYSAGKGYGASISLSPQIKSNASTKRLS